MRTNVYSVQNEGIHKIKKDLSEEWTKTGKFEMVTSSVFGIIAVEMDEQYVQYINSINDKKNKRIPIPDYMQVTKVRNFQITDDGRLCLFRFYLPSNATNNMLQLTFDEDGNYTGQEAFKYAFDAMNQWPLLHFTSDLNCSLATSFTKNDIIIYKYCSGRLTTLKRIQITTPNSQKDLKAVDVTPKIIDGYIYLWYAISDCGTKNTTLMIGNATLNCNRIKIDDLDKDIKPELIGTLSLGYSNQMEFTWSHDNQYAILLSKCFIDIEKGTYGGTTKLYILKYDGSEMKAIQTTSDVQCAAWRPFSHNYLSIEGKSYNRIFYRSANDSSKCLYEFPKGYKNTICWNFHGNAVALGGFGQMAGDIALWFINDEENWDCIAEWRESCTVKLAWAPDGETLLLASTFPRMKIDNFVKLYSNNGTLLKQLYGTRILDSFYESSNERFERPSIPDKSELFINKSQSDVYRTRQQIQNNISSEREGTVLQDLVSRIPPRKERAPVRPKKLDETKKIKDSKEPWRPKKIEAAMPSSKEEDSKEAPTSNISVTNVTNPHLLRTNNAPNTGSYGRKPDIEMGKSEIPGDNHIESTDSGNTSRRTSAQAGMMVHGITNVHETQMQQMHCNNIENAMDDVGMLWNHNRQPSLRQDNPTRREFVHPHAIEKVYINLRGQQMKQQQMKRQQMGYGINPAVPAQYVQRNQILNMWNMDPYYGYGGTISDNDKMGIVSNEGGNYINNEYNEMWQYIDSEKNIQGPFDTNQMRAWYNQGWLQENLEVRTMPHHKFTPLNKLFNGREPFTNNDTNSQASDRRNR